MVGGEPDAASGLVGIPPHVPAGGGWCLPWSVGGGGWRGAHGTSSGRCARPGGVPLAHRRGGSRTAAGGQVHVRPPRAVFHETVGTLSRAPTSAPRNAGAVTHQSSSASGTPAPAWFDVTGEHARAEAPDRAREHAPHSSTKREPSARPRPRRPRTRSTAGVLGGGPQARAPEARLESVEKVLTVRACRRCSPPGDVRQIGRVTPPRWGYVAPSIRVITVMSRMSGQVAAIAASSSNFRVVTVTPRFLRGSTCVLAPP